MSEHPKRSTLQPRGLSESGVQLMGLLVGTIGTYFGNHLNLCVLWHLVHRCCDVCLQGSQRASKPATFTLMNPPAEHSEEEGV